VLAIYNPVSILDRYILVPELGSNSTIICVKFYGIVDGFKKYLVGFS
jgi:hypothetical protein